MRFHTVKTLVSLASQRQAPCSKIPAEPREPARTSTNTVPLPEPTIIEEEPAEGKQAIIENAQNLLKHIPGEASGFYIMAVDSIEKPSLSTVGLIFVMALILLLAVRQLADASRDIMLTTIGAFLLWMFIFDKGLLNMLFPNLLPDPLGLILAVFYSTLITLLAGAGKIR
jgi:hypothetical protein